MVREHVVLDATDLAISTLLLLGVLRVLLLLLGGCVVLGFGRGRRRIGWLIGCRGPGTIVRSCCLSLDAWLNAALTSTAAGAIKRRVVALGGKVQRRPRLEQCKRRPVVMPLVRLDLDVIPTQMLRSCLPGRIARLARTLANLHELVLSQLILLDRPDDLAQKLDRVLGAPDGLPPRLGQLGRTLAVAVEPDSGNGRRGWRWRRDRWAERAARSRC
uniref:(northern house mosquito) hypothetical protein n=1 Tax=Culex pipiens TaxID=7175 RepID=A0A8D8GUS8_CULPI